VGDFVVGGDIDFVALVDHLNKVASSKELYNSYHVWRQGGLPDDFVQRYKFTDYHSICRDCRFNMAMHYPDKYKFDQKTQELIYL
jgi:hypothetical protein